MSERGAPAPTSPAKVYRLDPMGRAQKWLKTATAVERGCKNLGFKKNLKRKPKKLKSL